MKRLLSILTCFLMIGGLYGAIPSIKKDSVILKQIIDNDLFDLKQGVSLKLGILDEEIKKREKEYQNLDSIDVIPTICLSAFMKWCDMFLEGKRKYIVADNPLGYFNYGNVQDFWPKIVKSEYKHHYEKDGTQVIFNPFNNKNVCNDYLMDGNVVLQLRRILNEYGLGVTIEAAIPFNHRLFRFYCSTFFDRQLDRKALKAKDEHEAILAFGKLIASHHSEFIDEKGFFLPNVLGRYFKCDFYMEEGLKGLIKEIDYNPSKEIITVYQLFDYEN